MTRPLRIQYDGAWYHVMNRGAERKPIFQNDHHRYLFLELLAEIVEAYKIEIHAYCLMDNHYHLLIRTPLGNLADAMRHLGCVYTLRFNKSLNIDGPLFRGRYKTKLVQDESYALHLVRYIHLNPLRAGMVNNPKDYKWSSYRAYVALVERPRWLSVKHTVSQFNKTNFIDEFRHFTISAPSINIDMFFSEEKRLPIIGSTEFIDKIKSTLDYHDLSKEFSERRLFKPPIFSIISAVANTFCVTESSIKAFIRGETNQPRNCIFYIARKHFGYKLVEICDVFEIKCYQTVSYSVYQFEAILKLNDVILNNYQKALLEINLMMSN